MPTYGTLADFKARIAVTGVAEDTMLTSMLAEASSVVEEIKGQTWTDGAGTRKYGRADALLDEWAKLLFLDAPLTSVATLTNGDGVVVAAADYFLLPRNGPEKWAILLDENSGLVWRFGGDQDGEIQVNGVWVVPAKVIGAVYGIAEAIYRRGEKGAISFPFAVEDAKKMLGATFRVGAV